VTVYRTTLPNINKNSDRPNEELALPKGANGRLYGLAAVRNPCPSGDNNIQYVHQATPDEQSVNQATDYT